MPASSLTLSHPCTQFWRPYLVTEPCKVFFIRRNYLLRLRIFYSMFYKVWLLILPFTSILSYFSFTMTRCHIGLCTGAHVGDGHLNDSNVKKGKCILFNLHIFINKEFSVVTEKEERETEQMIFHYCNPTLGLRIWTRTKRAINFCDFCEGVQRSLWLLPTIERWTN